MLQEAITSPHIPLPILYKGYIGWVGVLWQRHCKTCRSLHELGQQGTVFFGGRSQLAVELDHLRGVETFLLRTRGLVVSRSVNMVRHPRGSYIVLPLLSLDVAIPENKSTH